MAGERLSRVEVSASGLAGDRVVQVYRANGRVATARTCPGLLGHRARLDQAGEPLVDGRHEHTGEGCLGLEPFRRLLHDSRFAGLPLLMETEKSPGPTSPRTVAADPLDMKNLTTLRRLREAKHEKLLG